MDDCVFCKIIKDEVPSKKVAENESVVAFYDVNPSADTHILIVPKKHVETFVDMKKEDESMVLQMFHTAQELISSKGLEGKYKLVVNGGEYQFVPHLHLHLLGGEMKKEAE